MPNQSNGGQQQGQKKSELVQAKEETVDVVTQKIKFLESRGEIQFPPDYSPQNALRSAWLQLQETKDKQNRPVLQVCSRTSIMNALFDMVVQGLNVRKDQGYFIAYGQQLAFQRSYFGDECLAQRVDKRIVDVEAQPIFSKDEFEWGIERGKKQVLKHKPSSHLGNRGELVGAYCILLDQNGDPIKTDIMSWTEIKQSWKRSPTRPFQDDGETLKPSSNHAQMPGEMAKRTVIRRCLKPIINSSNDRHLFEAANRAEQIQAEVEAEAEETANANQDVIDVETQEAQSGIDEQTGEVLEFNPESQAPEEENEEREREPEAAETDPGF